jgi:homospermidine synthase
MYKRRKEYLGDFYTKGREGIDIDTLEQLAKRKGCTLESLKSACFFNFSLDVQDRRILIVGYGGIGNNMIPLFKKHLKIGDGNILVYDMNKDILPGEYADGIRFKNLKIDKHNYKREFDSFLRPGDLLLDLAYYIDTLEVIKWCKDKGIMFINAAVEEWEESESNDLQYPKRDPRLYTLYKRQMMIQRDTENWKNTPTAIITHGANPGWVSHTTKIALRDWVNHLEREGHDMRKERQMLNNKDYPELAKQLEVQVIQIAEKDTLRQSIPRRKGEFICTWSPQGFIEEGIAPAELGWGTHETKKDVYSYKEGPKNQVCFNTRGIDTYAETFVPSGNYLGMIVRHEEAFSISDYLTVKRGNKVVYRPTVYYCYQPCDDAISSLYEMKSNAYKQPTTLRLPKHELIDGNDELGCFLLSKKWGGWWIGTTQSVQDAEELCPGQSPTTLVVAAGVLAAVFYAFNHPSLGVIHPDDMEETEALDITLPYLYPFSSFAVPDWKPTIQAKFDTYNYKTRDWIIEKFMP